MRANKRLWCVRCVGMLAAVAAIDSSRVFAKEPLSFAALNALGLQASGLQPAAASQPAPSQAATKTLPASKPAVAKANPQHAGQPSAKASAEKLLSALDGRELFTRQWLPHDERSHGGDGLGPAFNDTSCAACHNQGGIGGGGANNHNVEVLTARISLGSKGEEPQTTKRTADDLAAIHHGFRAADEFVLHKYGTDAHYATFRNELLKTARAPVGGQPNVATDEVMRKHMESVGIHSVEGPEFVTQASGLTVVVSKRNTTALYGVGLIDSIPDETLLKLEHWERSQSEARAGRVSRLPGGKIGHFGWKSQAASLEDFTMMACAVELGLTVPGRDQVELPTDFGNGRPSLDMTRDEVLALVSYMKSLPQPVQRTSATPQESEYLEAGREHLVATGCTFCHAPKVGNVDGIYSDLLLHDITPEVTRPYYGRSTGPSGQTTIDLADLGKAKLLQTIAKHNWSGPTINPLLLPADQQEKQFGSLGPEWRTPPLWGVRDSGPYLHDGQAETLEQAIALHGGQAKQSALAYFQLKPAEQQQLLAFLKSLSAPDITPVLAAR